VIEEQKVILIQDGAIDELMSVVFLTTMPNVTLSLIDVVNADCLGYPTYEVTWKILKMLKKSQTLVTMSNARGWNPFPWSYRQYSMMVNLLPMINQYQNKVEISKLVNTEDVLHKQLVKQRESGIKSTILCLGPLTDVANYIKSNPEYKNNVDSIVWMGGVYTPAKQREPMMGNIDTGIAPGANPHAEWNAYWDPDAVNTVLKSGIDFKMFPLNVTNKVFLTPEIIRKHFIAESKAYPILDLAAQMYSMVAFQYGYSFWDTVTTAYLGKPDLFGFDAINLSIDTSRDPSKQGTISIDNDNGFQVHVATSVHVDRFYKYFVGQLKKISQ